MNQYPCHYCRHCFASRIALKQRCRPAAAQVHPEKSDGRCGRSGTRHRLRDERPERFDERVDSLDGDGADAVPLLAGRLGRRDAESLESLGPVAGVSVQAAVADAVDVGELSHCGMCRVLPGPKSSKRPRSSHNATGVPGRKRPDRRLFTIEIDGEFLIVAHADHLIWA
jgi:hypothetical protein